MQDLKDVVKNIKELKGIPLPKEVEADLNNYEESFKTFGKDFLYKKIFLILSIGIVPFLLFWEVLGMNLNIFNLKEYMPPLLSTVLVAGFLFLGVGFGIGLSTNDLEEKRIKNDNKIQYLPIAVAIFFFIMGKSSLLDFIIFSIISYYSFKEAMKKGFQSKKTLTSI